MSVAKQNLKAALFLAKKVAELQEENARLRKELMEAKFSKIGNDCLCAKDGGVYYLCPIHGTKGTPR